MFRWMYVCTVALWSCDEADYGNQGFRSTPKKHVRNRLQESWPNNHIGVIACSTGAGGLFTIADPALS